MSYSVQIFLNKGLIKFSDKSLTAAKLVSQTSKEFVELIDDYLKLSKNKFKSKMILEKINIQGDTMSEKGKVISYWFQLYAQVKNYKLKKSISGGITVFNLIKNLL